MSDTFKLERTTGQQCRPLSKDAGVINDETLLSKKPLAECKLSTVRDYKGLTLRTVFQPIFSIAHRRAVGYEALVRSENSSGDTFPIDKLFSLPESSKDSLQLDRICREIHIKNFSMQNTTNEWLFINLDSQCLETEKPHVGFMDNLFSLSGIKPHRVVIEILESEIKDRVYLKQLVDHFRAMGCLLAIDDFGAGHSNFDRIWEIEPDIVKIDRSLVKHASTNSKIKRILSGMISLIHETGCLVIVEGVETKQEALAAIEAQADMLQGFYFAMPMGEIQPNKKATAQTIDNLIQQQTNEARKSTLESDLHFKRFITLFDKAAEVLSVKGEFTDCATFIFKETRAIRCFLLNSDGYQIGSTIHAAKYEKAFTKQLSPLLSGDNASWSHKHYHYRAINKLGKLQVTRPYLSVAGKHMCVTVSKTVVVDGEVFVFCCDLDWQDK